MSNQNYKNRPVQHFSSSESGDYYYRMNYGNGHNRAFIRVLDKGLEISERIGWDVYLWPHRHVFGATVKLGYEDEGRQSLVVQVKTWGVNGVPEALHKELTERGFERTEGIKAKTENTDYGRKKRR